ncbi:hypothetical protein BC835DRAFT_1459730 [Cytidiella melzeri]|nr:hypothetical protein BC835DRAFT_1459730 [Cytidiella melzeri]
MARLRLLQCLTGHYSLLLKPGSGISQWHHRVQRVTALARLPLLHRVLTRTGKPSRLCGLVQDVCMIVLHAQTACPTLERLRGLERDKNWETERDRANSRSGVAEPVWKHSEESLWPRGIENGVIQDHSTLCDLQAASERPTHDSATEQDFHIHRILHGVPEGNTDIVPMHSVPMDANLDLTGAHWERSQTDISCTYTTSRGYGYTFLPSQFTPDIDIRAVNKDSPTEGSPKVRQRGSGKLLSSTRGVGLALLRLESLEFELPSEDGSASSKWAVNPWRPHWWPTFSFN